MSAAPEITFTVFQKGRGGKLRTDFSEAERAEIGATPERAAAFEALRVAADESADTEAAFETAEKDLSTRVRTFNELKRELVATTPKLSFMDLWRASAGK